MNKNIKLAVAGAVLALSASAANAGIVIPAGEWSLDIGGNVNAFSTWSKADGNNTIQSSFAQVGKGHNTTNGWGNGLLPNFLSVSGSTRQNDLDVGFTISLQPGTANNGALSEVGKSANGGLNNRQAFITFGDKSWGSIKMGKDLGIFSSDAILSDMTLLGVGALTPGGNTTLGRIGFGYTYADWKPQFAYTTPNFNGFQATVGITKHFTDTTLVGNGEAGGTTTATTLSGGTTNASPSYEGKASYSFAANDVTGKVWVSGIASKTGSFVGYTTDDQIAYAGDIGANLNMAGFGLTGYYYAGNGIGHMGQGLDGYGKKTGTTTLEGRDTDGGYVQATYILPTKTKLGVSWGVSNLDLASGETAGTGAGTTVGTSGLLVKENEMWTVGVYHPLTKHLNLVAEWNHQRSTNQANQENKANAGSLGAILFF
jgi:predicted porin